MSHFCYFFYVPLKNYTACSWTTSRLTSRNITRRSTDDCDFRWSEQWPVCVFRFATPSGPRAGAVFRTPRSSRRERSPGFPRCLTEAESGKSHLRLESQFNFSPQNARRATQTSFCTCCLGSVPRLSVPDQDASNFWGQKTPTAASLQQESSPASLPDPPFPRCLLLVISTHRALPCSPATMAHGPRPHSESDPVSSLPPVALGGPYARCWGPNNVHLYRL